LGSVRPLGLFPWSYPVVDDCAVGADPLADMVADGASLRLLLRLLALDLVVLSSHGLERSMLMRCTPIVTGLAFSSIVFATAPAQAQVKVDATKITCGEFVARPAKIATPLYLAAWISGYYHAKRNNRNLDLQAFEENMNKVESYCSDEKNSKVPVMEAVERVLSISLDR